MIDIKAWKFIYSFVWLEFKDVLKREKTEAGTASAILSF